MLALTGYLLPVSSTAIDGKELIGKLIEKAAEE